MFFIPILFSFCCFFIFLSSHFETFLYYFSQGNRFSFFVTDTNVLAARFLASSFFFSYVFYFPFLYFLVIFYSLPLCTFSRYFFRLRLSFVLLYLYGLSLFCNHFDFSDFTRNFRSSNVKIMIESVDFSSVTSQYMGTYWDFFLTLIFVYAFLFIILENKVAIEKIIYRFSLIIVVLTSNEQAIQIKLMYTNFWNVFRSAWFARCFLFCFRYYFFCGENFISDLCILILSGLLREIIIFIRRSFFFLHSRR